MDNNIIKEKIDSLILLKKEKDYFNDLDFENLNENQFMINEEISILSKKIEEIVYELDILNCYLNKNINLIKKNKNEAVINLLNNIDNYIKKNFKIINNFFKTIKNIENQNYNKINVIINEIKIKLNLEKDKILVFFKKDIYKKLFDGLYIKIYLFYKYKYYKFIINSLEKNNKFIKERIKFLNGNLNESDFFNLLINNNENNLINKYQNLINNEKNDKSFEEISKIYCQNNKNKLKPSHNYFSNSSINGLLKNYYNFEDKSIDMNNLNVLKEINEESNFESKSREKIEEVKRNKLNRNNSKDLFKYNYNPKSQEVPNISNKLTNKIEKEFYFLKTNSSKNVPSFNPYLSKINPPEKCGYELIYINIKKKEKWIEILNENEEVLLLKIEFKNILKFLLGTYTTNIISKNWKDDKSFNLPFSIIYQSGLRNKVKLDLLSNSINHINIMKKFIETFTKKKKTNK